MKSLYLLIATALLQSCGNEKKPETLVKSENAHDAPPVKYGVEGSYTGDFKPKTYKPGTADLENNRITIFIDSMNGEQAFGHSVVAGNERSFSGRFTRQGNNFIVDAREPGDDPYDGAFSFTLDTATKTITGTWTANKKDLQITERSYVLRPRAFRYDPALSLPEDIVGMSMPGTYNDDTGEGEMVTEDAIRFNASTTLLRSSDVENMYKADLELIRNAIYARHGYSFKNKRMRRIFDNYVEWYLPFSTNISSRLSETEQKNISLLKRYEAHAAKYYDAFGR
ncbi:MAG TPA: YARHG domain-containing protein [Flavisolibacter sp.]|nr:YARHG domain-containing protein [Flavisolibacter sp.]